MKKDRVQGMVRGISQWEHMSPDAVMDGSNAQVLFALRDARHDILALWSCLNRIEQEMDASKTQ